MDWAKTGHSYSIDVNVVHQTNVNNTLGSLRGVQLSDLYISENYYSDSRVQAKITTMVGKNESDGYIPNARLRIILSMPDDNFVEELVTGYVSDIDDSYSNGALKRTYTIEGTMWGLLDHITSEPITISKGAKLISTWKNLLNTLTMMQVSTDGAKDHQFSNTIIYEAGSSLATVLFELSSGYDRMDVDGHGVITLKEYKSPSKRTPSRIIDYNDMSSLVIAPLSRRSEEYSIPGRAVITATVSKITNDGRSMQEVVVGSYDAPKTHFTSMATRGYLYGITDSYNGVSDNPTKAELDSLAKATWEDLQEKGIEWTGTHVFADFHAGEVVTLIAPTNLQLTDDFRSTTIEAKKVLISAVETNLQTFQQNLTLKEV